MHLRTIDHVLHFGGRGRNMLAHLANDALMRGRRGHSRRGICDEPVSNELGEDHSQSQHGASHLILQIVVHNCSPSVALFADGSEGREGRKSLPAFA